MLIAIGTKNPSKIKAIENVLSKYYNDAKFISVNVKSEVSEQPTTDSEAIKGAINRAINAKKETGVDIGVGLEGSVGIIDDEMFLTGWSAIISDKIKGIGSGSRMQLPNKVKNKILKGRELGPIMENMFPNKKI